MTLLLVAWLAIFTALLISAIGRPGERGALTLSYFLGLSLIHVPGILSFLDPTSDVMGREPTRTGFEMTLIGMTAFAAGAIAARRTLHKPVPTSGSVSSAALADIGWRLFGLGAMAYFVLIPGTRLVPSAVSIVSSMATLMIVGLWLRLYSGVIVRNAGRVLSTLGGLPLLPLATLTTGGFIGYGVNWALSVVTFHFVVTRRRRWYFLLAPVVVFLGLSLFVSYMGQRTGIRDAVWREHATLGDRLERISAIVTNFQVLDLGNTSQQRALTDRLNQNLFVGLGVERHRAGLVDLYYGSTVAPLALIPRAIWPDKPEVGGSRDLVSSFTGVAFAPGTSVGVGSVLEFYMNFGVPGLIVGFAGLGFTLMWLDLMVMAALATGDVRSLLLSAMPGLVLLQPGGSFLEIIVGAAAAYVTARCVVLVPVFGVARPRTESAGPVKAPVRPGWR